MPIPFRKISPSKNILPAAFVLFLINGCATSPVKPAPMAQERNLKTICRSSDVHWDWDSLTHVIILEKNKIKARGLLDSRIVVVDNETVILNDPVRRINNMVMVPADFQSKVIGRLGHTQNFAIGKWNTIILDAGHGGKDPGAISRSGLKEKIVVLDITQRLKDILESKGVKVKLTRDRDVFLSLQERTEYASKIKADLFVSIHANANNDRSIRGLEVYTSRDLGYEDLFEPQRKTNEKIMFNEFKMSRNSQDLQKIVADMLYTNKQMESRDLAMSLAKETCRCINAVNRGTRTAGFFVLRNTLIPALLVEVGYLTNTEEEKLLNSPSYRQEVAQGIAQSLLDYPVH